MSDTLEPDLSVPRSSSWRSTFLASTMEAPAIQYAGTYANSGNTSPSNERRKQLPTVPMLSTLFPKANNKDYSQFALSPIVARPFGRLAPSEGTPITAIHLNDVRTPAIASSASSPGMSLLDRYLAEHEEPLSPVELLQSPFIMQKARNGGMIQTPRLWTALAPIVGSPPESATDCFSPLLGDGPAEMFQEDSTYELPTDDESEADTENTFVEEECGSRRTSRPVSLIIDYPEVKIMKTRRNSFPRYGAESKVERPLFADVPKPQLLKLPVLAPSRRRHTVSQGSANSSAQAKPSTSEMIAVMAPPPAPTVDTFSDQLPEVQLYFEASPFDPPPAPTLDRFSEDFPASPITAGPAPINTSLAEELMRLSMGKPTSPGANQAQVAESDLADLSIRSPPPAPTQLSFGLQLPASPVRSKPSPIDTTATEAWKKATNIVISNELETPGMPPPPPMQDNFAGKTSKLVRFAVSPLLAEHFRYPVSPISPSPRFNSFFGHIRTFSADEAARDYYRSRSDAYQVDSSIPPSPFSPTFSRRGRSPTREGRGVKDSQFWRSSRSQSPKRSAKMHSYEEEYEGVSVLPDTVYDEVSCAA